MIGQKLQISMLLAVAFYFAFLFYLLRKKRLNLKYTLLWIFSGAIMLTMALFPQIIAIFAALVGIQTSVNALFAMMFFCVIIILMSLTAIVSKQNEKVNRLVQNMALLEKRVRDLEHDHISVG